MSARQTSDFARHFLLVFGSQLVVFASGLIKSLVVPVVLGVSDYGYWQIYVFYAVYVGGFTLGHNDGIYLKYGGYRFEDLPFATLRASNVMYVFLLALGATMIAAFAATATDPQREIVFFAVAANILVLGATSNISLSLQAANQMKDFAFLNAADKIFFTLALLALFDPQLRTFWYLISVDLVGKSSVLVFLLFRYRQLYVGPFAGIAVALSEFCENLRSGIQLMVANLSGMLVLGIGRIIIEYFGSPDSYSHYAFATSLASVVLMSVTAMSVVIYPSLKQQDEASYIRHFEMTNKAYSVFSLLMLSSYFAAIAFISLVAKSYSPVIEFLNVIFVITALQGKMQLINNTFYKALRLEGLMLRANLMSLVIATGLSALGYALTDSLLAIAYATLLTMLFLVYASETFLRWHMASRRTWGPLLEAAVLASFLGVTNFLPPLTGFVVWSLAVVLISIYKREQLASLMRRIQSRTQ
jgi:O-antigen/teichoic acid export membrane protein